MPGESHGQRSLAGYSPRGLKESDTSEPLSLPLHVMILKSKLTVIIKFSLNIQEFLNDGKQDKGNHSFHYIHYVSLYYVVGFLSVSASGESSHNGLSEGLRRSLNQPTGTSGGKQNKTKPAVSCGQKLPVILLKREGGGKNRPGDTVEQHCHLQATETKTPQARKKIHRFCWVFPQRTGQRGRES